MLTVLVSTISNLQILLLKKCECKSYSHFFSKNVSVYAIFNDWSFNNTCILTNNIFSFEQLGPDRHLVWVQQFTFGQSAQILWVYTACQLEHALSLVTVLEDQGPVVQSLVSLTSSLRVISLTVFLDSIDNILIFFAEKMWVAFAVQKLLTFFQQKISAYLHITRCKF